MTEEKSPLLDTLVLKASAEYLLKYVTSELQFLTMLYTINSSPLLSTKYILYANTYFE